MPAESATYLYATRAWKYPDARPEAHQKPRLGFAQADALWAELNERRAQERIANERCRAPRMIAELEACRVTALAQGKATARIEQQLRRWRALID